MIMIIIIKKKEGKKKGKKKEKEKKIPIYMLVYVCVYRFVLGVEDKYVLEINPCLH